MQKKQIIQFSVLLLAILALAGAYFGIRSYNRKQEEQKKQQEAAAEITLTSFQPDSVTAISYDYNGTEYAYTKEGDDWKETGNTELTLDQDAFSEFLKTTGSITSDTQVQAQEGEDYGFEEPLRVVTITTTSGTSSLTFGMKNEMLGQYYVKTSESSKIYLVEPEVYTAFDKTAEDFEKEETDTDADSETDTQAD